MSNTHEIEWHDPFKKIWGFHVHQEHSLDDFSKALVIQKHCSNFMKVNQIPICNDDAIKPGYGPHLNYMWELRVENLAENVLEKMGLAISYMAINRFGLSAYIHPLMHDSKLPETDALAMEGHYNQKNALWFGYRVPQNQDFFFNPPRSDQGLIVDTRTHRILTNEEKNKLYEVGLNKFKNNVFNEPSKIIINGFHLHMDFEEKDRDIALAVFDKFLIFLLNENLRPTSTRIYGAGENGPHLLSGWEIKFETCDMSILTKIGIAIGWLMCNRQHLSVFIHPVTWNEGDHREELKAHQDYSFFIGFMPELDLSFFYKKVEETIFY